MGPLGFRALRWATARSEAVLAGAGARGRQRMERSWPRRPIVKIDSRPRARRGAATERPPASHYSVPTELSR